jgi:ATPase family associated with various cellular activities (AAA)
MKSATQLSQNELVKKEILANLERLGGLTVQEDALIFSGEKMILPAQFEGRIPEAIKYLDQFQKSQETTYNHKRSFPYRPWDGAHAFQEAMRRVFGSTGIGEKTTDLFGREYPPELRTIDVGVGKTAQVPWGKVAYAPLNATFCLDAAPDAEMGLVFNLGVEAPRKYRRHFEAFFEVVEQELAERSIYRGKAITGALMPKFVDTSAIDPDKVIYSADVFTQLDANLWTLIRHPEVMADLGVSLKRSVLVEGPYGTGKTLAGMLTAQLAEAHGWTFVLTKPGDDLQNSIRTARLYQPAIVWYEDIDIIASDGTAKEISDILEALDGITAKGARVIAGFTTNHADKIHKGVLRPGRMDAA